MLFEILSASNLCYSALFPLHFSVCGAHIVYYFRFHTQLITDSYLKYFIVLITNNILHKQTKHLGPKKSNFHSGNSKRGSKLINKQVSLKCQYLKTEWKWRAHHNYKALAVFRRGCFLQQSHLNYRLLLYVGLYLYVSFCCLLGPCWSWWGPWHAWRTRQQGTLWHYTTFPGHVTYYEWEVYCIHKVLLQAFYSPWWLWILMTDVCLYRVTEALMDSLDCLVKRDTEWVVTSSLCQNHVWKMTFLMSETAF